ncbi:MAG: family 43 glycosylhydrolase, partial [Marinoscillum sp.]
MRYFLICVVFLFGCNQQKKEPGSEKTPTYSNPIDVEFGDPYILDNGDGTYYMYGTGGGAKDGFATYSSNDLVDWKFEGQVYTGNTDSSWNEKWFWAPEVYKREDKYYLFFSAQWK